MRRHLLSIVGVLALLMGLSAAQCALATTTTLTFDEFTNGTVLTTQYQGVGVTVDGAQVYLAGLTAWTANTPPNIVYAGTARMTFTVDSTITGAIQIASAYIAEGSGIYAYDAAGVLIGQALVPPGTTGILRAVSVHSSGNPIASVAIQGPAGQVAADTLSFATAVVNNLIPVADAGAKQKVRIGSLVTLDGSRSVDPDHQPQPLTYHWAQTFGPTVALSGATTVTPTFTPLIQGNYVFSLVVNDGQNNSNVAFVKVTASKNGNLSAESFGDCVLCNPFAK